MSAIVRIMERLVESCREAKNALKNTDICWWTYSFISCFAINTWITVNGVWSEFPVIVVYAPESWSLASYVVVIIQLGIIGPILYSLASRLCPRIFTEKFTIFILIFIAISSLLLLVLFWKRTTVIDGKPHSLAFMILVFSLSLVDCTSTVVFLTFMSLYDPRYLTALYIGESLCGLLPGIAAIIQGSPNTVCNGTGSPNSTAKIATTGLLFDAEAYFLILLGMVLLSAFAFISLNYLPFARREQKSQTHVDDEDTIVGDQSEPTTFADSEKMLADTRQLVVQQRASHISGKHIVLFIMQAICCSFSFGILPSLSPFAYEPYGSVAYHLVASLGPIGSSIMCFFIIWFKKTSFASIFAAFAVFTLCAIYQVLLAHQSPTPWLHTSNVGRTIAVLVGIIATMLSTYQRLSISIIMREESKRALYWCGMSIQIGSFIGAFSIFPFVDVLHEFHQKNPCS